MGFVEERVRKREKVIGEAFEWAEGVPYKATAVLIGSYARGDFNLWSDVDVLLVAEFSGSPVERLRPLDMPPGFQVIPLTEEEFIRLFRRGDPLTVEALRVGVTLRDDFEIVVRMKQSESGGD